MDIIKRIAGWTLLALISQAASADPLSDFFSGFGNPKFDLNIQHPAGVQIKVTTVANKPKKDDKKPDEEKKSDVDKKSDDEKKPDDKKDPGPKTIASMVMVLEDAGPAPATDPKKKKKNN